VVGNNIGKFKYTADILKSGECNDQICQSKQSEGGGSLHVRYWVFFHSMLDVRCSMLGVHLFMHSHTGAWEQGIQICPALKP